MDNALLSPLVVVLTAAVAFNLWLTLRLARIVDHAEYERAPSTLVPGEPLPEITGHTLLGGRRVSSADLLGRPSVIVFLSPDCEECRARLQELVKIRPAMDQAGLAVWVVGAGSKSRVRSYLKEASLLESAVVLNRRAQRRLNPKSSVPFYIFTDHLRRVQTSNFIGDENWVSFVEQMLEVEAKEAARA